MNINLPRRLPQLTTDRLVLRAMRAKDAVDIFTLRSDPEVMRYMDTEPFATLKEAREWIRTYRSRFHKKQGIVWALALKGTERQVGYAGFWRLMPDHFRAEIAYALRPEFWGKGLMQEAVRQVIAFGFSEMGLHSIEAAINPGNVKSRQLLEKMHFRQEAHFRENFYFDGRFLDTIIFSLLKSDFQTENKIE